MRRFGQVIRLAVGSSEEYERLHRAVWPTVLETIASCGIRNYSIFRHGDVLFAYFEYVGQDFGADMARMSADPETQRWWSEVKPLQRPVSDAPEGMWWRDLVEVFHVE